MKRFFQLYILFCVIVNASAQNIFNPVGAEAWGVGGISVVNQNIWSVFNNPAGFSAVKKVQGGISSEQRFRESKLNTSSVGIVLPSKYINTGIGIHHFGYSLFNQQFFRVAVSKQLFKQFSIGVSLNYFATNISEQPHSGNMLGDAGILYQASSKIKLGLYIFNPTQSRYSVNTSERIPTYSRFGIEYLISDKVKLLAETEQQLNQKSVFRGGIHYQLHPMLSLSAGAANNPVYVTFGTGVTLKQFKVDFAASVHEVLGFTPHLSIIFPAHK